MMPEPRRTGSWRSSTPCRAKLDPQSLEARVREKDTQLRELQHRVKNNLQMITALIRLETRNAETVDQIRL